MSPDRDLEAIVKEGDSAENEAEPDVVEEECPAELLDFRVGTVNDPKTD